MSISEQLPNRQADDNNANEIIRYCIDVQKCAKFLGVISSHAQIPKPIFFIRAHCNGKKGVISFHLQKILVSIVKYNNISYLYKFNHSCY
jgi:hypothetical protein